MGGAGAGGVDHNACGDCQLVVHTSPGSLRDRMANGPEATGLACNKCTGKARVDDNCWASEIIAHAAGPPTRRYPPATGPCVGGAPDAPG